MQALDGGQWSTSLSGRLTAGKEHTYSQNMRLDGPQNRPGRFGRRKISYPSTFRTPDLQVITVFDILITLLPGAGIAQSI